MPLYEMLAEIWPDESASSLDRRWWWRHAVPPLTVAEDSAGAIAGMCGAIPFRMASGADELRGAWIVDFFVRASHQGQGIGKRLVGGIKSDYDFLASLNQTDAAWAAFTRSGWRDRTHVPFFLLPTPALYAARTLGKRRAGGLATSVQDTPQFGAEFDDLWARLRPRLGTASIRDAQTLGERFGNSSRRYTLVRSTRADLLEGYAVVRELPPGSIRSFARFPILMVSDYLAPPDSTDVFASLMDAVVRRARDRGLHFVLCMSNYPAHQAWLRGGGFLSAASRGVGRRLTKLNVGFTATPDAPTAPWHLTPYDCDLDILFGGQS